jgi:hypothetical protein
MTYPTTILPPPIPCLYYHVVKQGEKTNVIAQTYKIKWSEIAKANGLGNVENFEADGILCIPKSKPADAKESVEGKQFSERYWKWIMN